jgi:hypothetical protein
MSFVGIAAKAGTVSANIKKLINTGEGSPGLASRIGTTSARITEFVSGEASPGIAHALGTTTANAQLLRDSIGRDGAIGLIIGLACGLGRED